MIEVSVVCGRCWSVGRAPSPAKIRSPQVFGAKEKAVEISLNSLYLSRRLPTLPHTFACSTIGPAGLNFRVRDGNGWIPRGKITDNLRRFAVFELRRKPLARGQLSNVPAAGVLVAAGRFYANVVGVSKSVRAMPHN